MKILILSLILFLSCLGDPDSISVTEPEKSNTENIEVITTNNPVVDPPVELPDPSQGT